MKYIVSLSGGIGSYFTLRKLINQGINKSDIECVFADTLNENGDLYRFLDDIEVHFDLHITRLCQGKTPFELAWEENFLYNSRVANCSKKLKSKPFMEYIKDRDPEETVICFGIDFTEYHRCAAIERNYAPFKCMFPLCQEPYLYKNEMLEILKEDGIDIPTMYKQGFGHNNCNGFCFKAGIGHYKNLLKTDRNKYLECENKEEALRRKIGKDVSIMKRNGRPFTLRTLRLLVDAEPEQISLFEDDWGACGCFVDDELTMHTLVCNLEKE